MTPLEFLQQYYWIMIVAYAVGFIAVIAYFLMKNRGKILVRIKRAGMSELEVWKQPEIEGQKTTITMREGNKRNPGWKFTVDTDCLVPKKKLLGTYFAVDVYPDATRACKWKSDSPDAEQPKWTKKESAAFINKRILDRMGEDIKDKGISSGLLYAIIIIQIASTIVIFLVSTGRLKL